MLGFIKNRTPHGNVSRIKRIDNNKQICKFFFIPFDIAETTRKIKHTRQLVLCYNMYKGVLMEGCLYAWSSYSLYTCRVYSGNFDTALTFNGFCNQQRLLQSDIVLIECSMFSKLIPSLTIESIVALDGRYSVLSAYLGQYSKYRNMDEVSDFEIGISLHSRFLNRFRMKPQYSTLTNPNQGREIEFDDIREKQIKKIQYISLSTALCTTGDPIDYILVVLITTEDGFVVWSQIGDFECKNSKKRSVTTHIVKSICKHFLSGRAEIPEIILP